LRAASAGLVSAEAIEAARRAIRKVIKRKATFADPHSCLFAKNCKALLKCVWVKVKGRFLVTFVPVRDGQFLFEVEGRISISKASSALGKRWQKIAYNDASIAYSE
jgi:ribosomal protein L16/L10AE